MFYAQLEKVQFLISTAEEIVLMSHFQKKKMFFFSLPV